MSFEKTMLSIAMESGEVTVPEEMVLEEDYGISDAAELIGSSANEIQRGVELASSLEALAIDMSGQEITELSVENYHKTVTHLFAVAGMAVPASIVVPSFEAASKDKASFASRARAAVDSLIKWVRERLSLMRAQVQRLKIRFQTSNAASAAKLEKADAHVSEVKAEGAFAVGEHTGEVEFVTRGAIAQWLIVDGKFSKQAVIDLIKKLHEGDSGKLLNVDVVPEGFGWNAKTAGDVHKSIYGKLDLKKVSTYHGTVDDVTGAAHAIANFAKVLGENVKKHDEGFDSFKADMEKRINTLTADQDPADLKKELSKGIAARSEQIQYTAWWQIFFNTTNMSLITPMLGFKPAHEEA